MKYAYKETRKINSNSVRKLCIEKGWYTAGTNEEYAHLLFDIVGRIGNVTSDELVEIATDIKDHSVTDCEVTNIMYELAKVCVSFFDEI